MLTSSFMAHMLPFQPLTSSIQFLMRETTGVITVFMVNLAKYNNMWLTNSIVCGFLEKEILCSQHHKIIVYFKLHKILACLGNL